MCPTALIRAVLLSTLAVCLFSGAALAQVGVALPVSELFLAQASVLGLSLADLCASLTGLALMLAPTWALWATAEALRLRQRQAVGRAALALGLAAGTSVFAWWLGAMHGVLVTMTLDGVVPSATELPPLDLYLNPGDYTMVDPDGTEVALDLGALPEVLRFAGWTQAVALAWLPAAIGLASWGRARAWWRGVPADQ